MRRYTVWFLRILILVILFLPVFVPSLERERTDVRLKPVVVMAHVDMVPSMEKMLDLESKVKGIFGSKRSLELKTFGGRDVSPVMEFEELGTLVKNARGIVVIYAQPRLWGPAAHKFNRAFRASELFWLSPETIAHGKGDGSFLALNDVYMPAMSFLGEESRASVDVVGHMPPNAQVKAELVLRSGESILSSRGIDVESDATGRVSKTYEVPVGFARPGTQAMSVQLNSPISAESLDIATTTVNVVHAKTTFLHIALGPDFSVRALRSKLKFWPNLDLVSYYILRDIFSENSVPNHQLSLIEFPSAKLFGEQLPNFHGVIIQNFPFGTYLGPEESKNLVEYVKSGGRVFLQAGPLSFSSSSSLISQLYPCKNVPTFDTAKTYRWVPGSDSLVGGGSFFEAVRNMESGATAIGCEPVEGAMVLAKTMEGDHPVVVSKPLGKGLVVTLLSGDWLYRFAQIPSTQESLKSARVQEATSSHEIFRWVTEFLQRRQDGGVRPPDLVGPRIFAGDDVVLVRSRGLAQVNTPIGLSIDAEKVLKGRLLWLDFLGMEVARFQGPVDERLLVGDRAQHKLVMEFGRSALQSRKAVTWPVLGGKSGEHSRFANPIVFDGLKELSRPPGSTSEFMARRAREFVPLLDVFPFLLALLLGLLALEQYLVHVLWRGKL